MAPPQLQVQNIAAVDLALTDHDLTQIDAGVTDADAELLKKAFNINIVGDLGKNEYFRAAQLLAELADFGAK